MLTLNTISHILLILIEPSRWLEQPQCRTVLRDIPAPAPPLRRPARQHRESGSPRPDQHPGSRSHDQRTGSQPYYLGLHHLRQRCHGTPHHHGARLPAWAVVWWATSSPTSQGSWWRRRSTLSAVAPVRRPWWATSSRTTWHSFTTSSSSLPDELRWGRVTCLGSDWDPLIPCRSVGDFSGQLSLAGVSESRPAAAGVGIYRR